MVRFSVLAILLFGSQLVSATTMERVISNRDFDTTQNRFIAALKQAEVPIYSTKDFEENLPGGFVRKGKEIQFASPYYGWHLGECHRGERKDAPLTARIWRDNQNRVWMEYPKPEANVNAFGVIECGNEMDKVTKSVTGFVNAATE